MTSKLVTVFGGSGFLGCQIVKRLAAVNYQVRVGVRYPDRASVFRHFGEDGRIALARADVCDEPTVARSAEGAASVIDIVGRHVEKQGAIFHRIHAPGALHVG